MIVRTEALTRIVGRFGFEPSPNGFFSVRNSLIYKANVLENNFLSAVRRFL